jgi:hypothetical protein
MINKQFYILLNFKNVVYHMDILSFGFQQILQSRLQSLLTLL